MTKTLLLVDDEAQIREALGEYLSDHEWTVLQAAEGMEALSKFRDRRPDAILTDLMMPRLDGLQFLREVRALDSEVPVVLLTGYGTVEHCRKALRAGANDFILKPGEPEQILELLNSLVLASQRRTEARARLVRVKREMNLHVPAELELSRALAEQVTMIARSCGCLRNSWGLRLALDEAFSNAVRHGAKMNREQVIEIRLAYENTGLTVTVTDPGSGFDASLVADPFHPGAGGRGIFLIKSVVDRVTWNGNVCTMIFDCDLVEDGAGTAHRAAIRS